MGNAICVMNNFVDFFIDYYRSFITHYALLYYRPVALTARASDSKSEGWGFKSLLACHIYFRALRNGCGVMNFKRRKDVREDKRIPEGS